MPSHTSLEAIAQVVRSRPQINGIGQLWMQLGVKAEGERSTYVGTLMARRCLQACCPCKLPSIGKREAVSTWKKLSGMLNSVNSDCQASIRGEFFLFFCFFVFFVWQKRTGNISSTIPCSLFPTTWNGEVLNIVVHQNIRLSNTTVSDFLT
jgi:hypothetical protein